MSAAGAATALAAGVEPHEEVPGPENGAQRCIRRPGSTWSLCSCPACKTRRGREQKLYRCGALKLPDREAAMARMLWWVDMGWEPSAIASATGLTPSGTRQMLRRINGGVRYLQGSSVAAILGAGRPTTGRMDATAARRRLRALAWNGWALHAIHERTGVSMMSLSYVRSQGVHLVGVKTHNAIADAYEHLQHQKGGSHRAAFIARQEGWAPPAAWDEDTLDDPRAKPEGVTRVTSAKENPFRPVDDLVLEEIGELHRLGHSDTDIARQLRRTPDAIQKLRHRHGIRRDAA